MAVHAGSRYRESDYASVLMSPRTAREFDLQASGANGEESPEALAMDGGTLPACDALAALDTRITE